MARSDKRDSTKHRFTSPKGLRFHLSKFLGDVVPPLRVLCSEVAVTLAFIGADWLLVYVIRWLSAGLRQRVPLVDKGLDAAETISLFVIVTYFLLDTFIRLLTLRKYSDKLERTAGMQ